MESTALNESAAIVCHHVLFAVLGYDLLLGEAQDSVFFTHFAECFKSLIKMMALMSGRWTDSSRRFAEELECKVFSKPFDINELQEWLDECKEEIDKDRILSDWFLDGNG